MSQPLLAVSAQLLLELHTSSCPIGKYNIGGWFDQIGLIPLCDDRRLQHIGVLNQSLLDLKW